jgi:hypothetical protein
MHSLDNLLIKQMNIEFLAEGKGFEPLRRLPAYTLSRRAPSTTRPPLPEKVPHYSEPTLPFKQAVAPGSRKAEATPV